MSVQIYFTCWNVLFGFATVTPRLPYATQTLLRMASDRPGDMMFWLTTCTWHTLQGAEHINPGSTRFVHFGKLEQWTLLTDRQPIMTISNNSPTSPDQTPMHPIEGWLPIIFFFGIMFVLYVILAMYVCIYKIARSNQLASPEDSEDAQSASSTNSETNDMQRLDSIAPPRTYKQVKMEMKLEGTGEHLARPDSFVTCVICLEAMRDSDTVRRLSCGHSFHSGCIASWYLTHHYTCPLCISRYIPVDLRTER
ncbi:hypothetical protein AUP68_18102 [Ilyonectria robusta]